MIITKENLHNYVDSLGYSTEELEEMKIGDSYEISTTINKIKRTALDEWLFYDLTQLILIYIKNTLQTKIIRNCGIILKIL